MFKAKLAEYKITANEIGLPHTTGDVSQGLANILKLAMTLVGMLAVVFILVGAIQMALAAGDPKRVAQARQTILYAVVGLILAIGAYAVVTFVTSSVGGK